MVQTETVVKQALDENIRPVLFINKLDRLITELKLSPEEVQKKLERIIYEFNGLIDIYCDKKYASKWKVSPMDGSVAFGSALHKWGFNSEIIKRKNLKFRDIINFYNSNKFTELAALLPVHKPVFDMIIHHIPSPREGQKYKIEKIWSGSEDSQAFNYLVNCSDDGPLILYVSNILLEGNRLICTARIFSGTAVEGKKVYALNAQEYGKLQNLSIYMGPMREKVNKVGAGNIVAFSGLNEVKVGETIVEDNFQSQMIPLENVKYVSEPVVTIAVEPKDMRKLPQLVELMKKIAIQDPNLNISINQETGEYLLSGIGELHLEIAVKDIEKEGIELITSQPIVIFRETVKNASTVTKTVKDQNKITVKIEPLSEKELSLLHRFSSMPLKKIKKSSVFKELNWQKEECDNLLLIDENLNTLIVHGSQIAEDLRNALISAVKLRFKSGILCDEPLRGIKVTLNLQFDSGSAINETELLSTVDTAIIEGIRSATPILLEPVYRIQITVPPHLIGEVSSLLTRKDGQIEEIRQNHKATITGIIPVRRSFGIAAELRSKTSGQAFWQTQFHSWQPVKEKNLLELINAVRKRKGLPPFESL